MSGSVVLPPPTRTPDVHNTLGKTRDGKRRLGAATDAEPTRWGGVGVGFGGVDRWTRRAHDVWAPGHGHMLSGEAPSWNPPSTPPPAAPLPAAVACVSARQTQRRRETGTGSIFIT